MLKELSIIIEYNKHNWSIKEKHNKWINNKSNKFFLVFETWKKPSGYNDRSETLFGVFIWILNGQWPLNGSYFQPCYEYFSKEDETNFFSF